MKEEDNNKLIAEIKEKLNDKSYSEISDILMTVLSEINDEIIYQNPV